MRIQQAAVVIASAAALAACGSATSSSSAPTPSTASTPSTAPTSGSGGGTASPTPTRPSFEPLLVAFTGVDPERGMLMLGSGQATVPMPSGPVIGGAATLAISGPFGARMIGTVGQQGGSSGLVAIVAVSSNGTVTTLEKNVAGSPSVVGRDDGQAWAWAVQTNSPACGSSTRAAFDIDTDEGHGARKIGSASFGAGITQVSLVAWTAAGIVAQGDNTCGGPGDQSTLAISPAIIIDPATGAAAGLASRIGTDCNFEAIADDGTIVCSVAGSAPALRVIAPDGRQTNYSISGLTSRQCINGGVELSADASFAAVSISCPTASGTRLVLLDLASGHVVTVTGASNLAPTLWTPDDVLIASAFGDHKTYSVATSGMAKLINSTYAAQTCINTC
ncbi:MAG: hypothetical protein ACYDCS_12345 [Candidatus Dormibacteria bacterium]